MSEGARTVVELTEAELAELLERAADRALEKDRRARERRRKRPKRRRKPRPEAHDAAARYRRRYHGSGG